MVTTAGIVLDVPVPIYMFIFFANFSMSKPFIGDYRQKYWFYFNSVLVIDWQKNINYTLNGGHWMSVGLLLNLLNQLNKIILCEPLASIILFYSTSSINFVLNPHECSILFITYIK
jgi:hypothetical protein